MCSQADAPDQHDRPIPQPPLVHEVSGAARNETPADAAWESMHWAMHNPMNPVCIYPCKHLDLIATYRPLIEAVTR
jgi:hypothetical protein